MIDLVTQRGPFKVRERWFAPEISVLSAFVPSVYVQSKKTGFTPGFSRKPFGTKIIELSQSVEALREACDKGSLYEIRRAEKDGAGFSELFDRTEFLNFYNDFAKLKGLAELEDSHLIRWGSSLRFFQAKSSEATLVMHAYLVDPGSSRARLLHSASHFRNSSDSAWRAQVGRANRFLHWMSALKFKEEGYLEYDLGGYALDTQDEALLGINKFKDGFGGSLKIESNYYSWSFLFLQWIRCKVRSHNGSFK